ncbi:Alpha-galactosidase [Pleurostoma richardsiae]|uniref:Alpha-galactosidase n=1 Tax=Pleurostoma richardsiae TaxID=41990 RepID=A0AA38VFJ8_9PEZI|nr:Alpha-galactosidase [Pleurostoma richardsiae]
MGFNNWARYMGALNESLFVSTAEAMISTGLLTAGYNRINLDDEWSTMERSANGSMVWDSTKFPRGLPWLTAHLKSRGFIPGKYTDAGNLSCGGFPGALNHEETDAADFARWGFEYLKLDGCNMPDTSEATYRRVYGKWHTILSSMADPMVFSESAPAYFAEAANLTDWYAVMGWVQQYGQLARHSRDSLVWNSTNYWPDITGWDSITFNYGQQVRLARFQRPGFFNDPDFLTVDHFDTTIDEKRSHFALWCAFSAPLILSTDVLNITAEEIAYLTNKDFLDVDQDPLVQQATLVSQDGSWDVLTRSLYNGDRLLVVLNRQAEIGDIEVPWARIGLSPETLNTPPSLLAKNLWTGKETTVDLAAGGIIAKAVPAHGTAAFRLSHPSPGSSVRVIPTGMIFNTYSLHCLTDSRCGSLIWANCTARDSQVWRARPDGTVSSLLDESKCITEEAGGVVATKKCDGEGKKWDYFVSGNLINAHTQHCLTEGEGGEAYAADCGYLTNEQVIALPAGMTI